MVKKNDKRIKCDICEQWCHAECVEMDELAYKVYWKEDL